MLITFSVYVDANSFLLFCLVWEGLMRVVVVSLTLIFRLLFNGDIMVCQWLGSPWRHTLCPAHSETLGIKDLKLKQR